VQCVGDNVYNQLGNGSAGGMQSALGTVQGLGSTYSIIGVGTHHTCAANSGGTNLRCWGNNNYGQLGAGEVLSHTSPVSPATTGTNGSFARISAGYRHSCAEDSVSRTIYCWGENSFGQLGDDTVIARNSLDSTEPVQGTPLGGSTSTRELVSGKNHSCVSYNIGANQSVYCWGANNAGQLGDNSTTNRDTPVNPTGMAAAAVVYNALAAGGDHTCAIVGTTLSCWGNNSYGESGQADMSSNFDTSAPGARGAPLLRAQ
jgi:alpha-tubulin suppressor-like RCC1 family protein